MNPSVKKIEAPASVGVNEPATIKVTTDTLATHLAMVKEDNGTVKTWAASGNSVVSGGNRIWTVQYTFSGAGTRNLGMKASSDARNFSEVVRFNLTIGNAAQYVTAASAKVSTVTKGSDIVFTVNTTTDAAKLALFNQSGTQLAAWTSGYTNSGSERVWTVKYAIDTVGSSTLTFKASKDGSTFDAGKTVAVTVSATGDFVYQVSDDFKGVTIKSYLGSAASVTVPAKYADIAVTKIGDSAFEGKTSLTSVTLPSTIEVIGKRAFANCSKLSSMS